MPPDFNPNTTVRGAFKRLYLCPLPRLANWLVFRKLFDFQRLLLLFLENLT
jgi:hypothetical protein